MSQRRAHTYSSLEAFFRRLVTAALAVALPTAALTFASREAAAQESKLDALKATALANPGDPNAALALGEAFRIAARYSESFAEFRRGIAVGAGRTPLLIPLYVAVARAYADRHDLPRAMASCKELEHLKAQDADVHVCNAMADLGWQRATEALEETAAALAKGAGSYDVKLTEGRAYELALRPIDAVASLRAALGIRPDAVEARVVLGRVLTRGGGTGASSMNPNRDDGLAELRKAVKLEPTDPDALYELASALGAGPGTHAPGGAPVDAETLALLGRATHERTSFTDAWLGLGTRQLASGNVAAAKDAADAALRSEPANVGALVLAGKVELASGRPDGALKDAQAALKILRNSAAATLLVADANAKKGELDPALEAYQSAWGLDHSSPDPLVHASEACHVGSRDTSARAFGAKAAQEFPAYGPAWAALGDALAGQKETKAARDAYRKALAAPDGAIDRSAVQGKLAALPQ